MTFTETTTIVKGEFVKVGVHYVATHSIEAFTQVSVGGVLGEETKPQLVVATSKREYRETGCTMDQFIERLQGESA